MSKRFGVRTWGDMFEGRLAQVASHLAFSARKGGKFKPKESFKETKESQPVPKSGTPLGFLNGML